MYTCEWVGHAHPSLCSKIFDTTYLTNDFAYSIVMTISQIRCRGIVRFCFVTRELLVGEKQLQAKSELALK